ncbi:FHA domain-containing protein At4g14490-like isoform X2 [Aristolochia californica]|uniref:FHA domain-containing protein At4g14490-like isoform X2 n=1 Tax=Aristolochia californica TaxID=171875 RepID=UPI0035E0C8EA
MEGPILKLVFNKGPREGEIIESHPRSKIRIGRVLRGNTLAIKDAGISQKHLLIEFNGVNWTISDLDSSNGTFLNESQINALKPFNLSDGDTIKIGERTSFLVKVEVKDENSDSKGIDSQPRRNAPRQTTLKRGLPKKDQLQVSEQQMPNSVASYCEKQEHEALGLEAELDAPANKGRGLRRRDVTKKAEVSGRHGAEEKVALQADAVLEAPANNARVKRQRRVVTRAAAKRDPVLVCEIQEIPENFESDHVKKWGQMAVGAEVERTAHLNDCGVSDHQENGSTVGGYGNISTSSTNANGGKECQDSGRGANDRIHWEKITLGEWFDRMEKYLPQKINEIADEIIGKLRNRQKQFDEYVSEHNNENQ